MIVRQLTNEIFFWAAWIIIPLLVEIVPAIGNFFILLFKRIRVADHIPLDFLPAITLMIPVTIFVRKTMMMADRL